MIFYRSISAFILLTALSASFAAAQESLRSVSEEKTARVGTGHFWVIDVEYRNQDDALVGVETWTGFGYCKPGQARQPGVKP